MFRQILLDVTSIFISQLVAGVYEVRLTTWISYQHRCSKS
uniref:Uncharacterized protein n=1 Tax=Arundo donax TaxID=35708 RepID=A0A0A8ZBD9_ARUDO